MKLSNFIEGLQILKPYYKDGDGFHIGAEHDIFYAYPTDLPVPIKDVVKLVALDWFQPEVETADDDGDFRPSDYDPEEGWAAFT